jgi:hypothetical protein
MIPLLWLVFARLTLQVDVNPKSYSILDDYATLPAQLFETFMRLPDHLDATELTYLDYDIHEMPRHRPKNLYELYTNEELERVLSEKYLLKWSATSE